MKVLEAAFVGYPVTDVARARAFYGEVLGLKSEGVDHEIAGMPGVFWIEYELGNVTLGISNAWPPSGQSGPTLALEVDDLDRAVERLKSLGVTFVSGILDSPVCRFALLQDPDANPLMLHQRRPDHPHACRQHP